jgi:hypothetical protein
MIDIEFDNYVNAIEYEPDGSAEVKADKPKFELNSDNRADWAIRKIADERAELDRLLAIADEQIRQLETRKDELKVKFERVTAYLNTLLYEYFQTVPHRKTDTTEQYQLFSGKLVSKKVQPKYEYDEAELVGWIENNRLDGYVTSKVKWGEFKKYFVDTYDLRLDEDDPLPVKVIPQSDKFDVVVSKAKRGT